MFKNRHTNPWTFAQVKALFESRNCTLISETYRTSNEKLTYRCPNGHEHALRFDHFAAGHGCPKCRSLRRWDGSRINLDTVKEQVIEAGFEVIFVERNAVSKIRIGYLCTCGYRSETSYQHFKAGKGCRPCAFAALSGEKNHRFNHLLTESERIEKRNTDEYRRWRKAVFDRDGYECRKCGARGYVVAHHLASFHASRERRTDLENGVTVCAPCHLFFHKKYGFTDNTPEQFRLFLEERSWV